MNLRGIPPWQAWAFGSLLLLSGVSAGVWVAARMYQEHVQILALDSARKTSRIQLLELVAQDHLSAGPAIRLDEATPDRAPSPLVAQTGTHKPGQHDTRTGPPQRPAPERNIVSPAKPNVTAKPEVVVTVARPSSPPDGLAPQPAARQGESSGPSVNGSELVEALKYKIEGVSADKAGVVRVEKDLVQLKNGDVVRPGGIFPSGERLLLVDHENLRLVTSKRQMLLFFVPK